MLNQLSHSSPLSDPPQLSLWLYSVHSSTIFYPTGHFSLYILLITVLQYSSANGAAESDAGHQRAPEKLREITVSYSIDFHALRSSISDENLLRSCDCQAQQWTNLKCQMARFDSSDDANSGGVDSVKQLRSYCHSRLLSLTVYMLSRLPLTGSLNWTPFPRSHRS